MNNIEDCCRYSLPIKKLTKANSAVINGRVVYIVKKGCDGKPAPWFCSYDYKTKVMLYFDENREVLIEKLGDMLTDDVIFMIEEFGK